MKRLIYRIIRKVVSMVTPVFQVEGAENLPEGPAVVAGNHSQAFGPIAAELYFPGSHYIWCISDMMEKDRVADYAYRDFWSEKPLLIRPFFRIFSYMLPGLAEIIFTNANTIPVYRDRRIMKTFQISSDRLKEGARVVIFPEDYTEHNNIVHKFQRGFVSVARYHYRQSGETVSFVPMYICPGLKKIVIGRPTMYNPNAGSKEETERICTYLQDCISEIAYSLPRHQVVPYPNVSRKYYPFNVRKQ